MVKPNLSKFADAGLTLAPLVMKVDPNVNVVLTAALTVFVGCYRSVKPTPPSVSDDKEINPSCLLLPLSSCLAWLQIHLLTTFYCKKCRRQCPVNTPCVFPLLGVQCFSLFSCFSSFYRRTWLMQSWHATFLCSGSLLFRKYSNDVHEHFLLLLM